MTDQTNAPALARILRGYAASAPQLWRPHLAAAAEQIEVTGKLRSAIEELLRRNSEAQEQLGALAQRAAELRDEVAAFRPAIALVGPVLDELDRAMTKFPTWPNDPLHALAILGEEFGELNKALLQLMYEPHKGSPSEARAEAIQTAAMALRLLISLDRYEYRRGAQHAQGAIATGGE